MCDNGDTSIPCHLWEGALQSLGGLPPKHGDRGGMDGSCRVVGAQEKSRGWAAGDGMMDGVCVPGETSPERDRLCHIPPGCWDILGKSSEGPPCSVSKGRDFHPELLLCCCLLPLGFSKRG